MKKFSGILKTTVLCALLISLISLKGYATIAKGSMLTIQVNGTTNPSFQQGVAFNYIITGTDIGGSVMNEMWVDVDSNGLINPNIDMLFVAFPQTDGQQSNQGPGDNDGAANGMITTGISGLSFPIGHYVFKTSTNTDVAYATYYITPLLNTTFLVSGTVTKAGIGLGSVVVALWSQNGQIFAITNAVGNYTIVTNLNAGTPIEVSIPNDGSFNGAALAGLVVNPNKLSTVITTNITGADFVVSSGKILMGKIIDGSGNPIANMDVSASIQNQNGNGYHALTDGNGRYLISLQPGDYKVMFGSYNLPKGYLLTGYHQQYINSNINLVHIASNVDTVKNIDASLYKGALITGTMKNNGSPIQGNVTAIDYNNPNSPLYQSGYDGNTGLYYFYVLPGTYSIYFQMNNGGNNGGNSGVYYNQASVGPGTAVVVNSINDTIRNINVDFGTVVACSTISTTNISICQNQLPFNWNGQHYSGGGAYTTHLMNAAGCDSAATLNLLIRTTSNSTTNTSICPNELPYHWNGLTFNEAGTQTIHLTNAAGCDSAANFLLIVLTGLPAITGANAVCAGSTVTLNNASTGGFWFTQATSQATINANTGVVTAKNAGVITIKYSLPGLHCASVTKSLRINPIPSVPMITYALGTSNPQAGAPRGNFCVGKVFTVVGSPNLPTGAWSATGFASVTNGGVVSVNGIGAGSIKYTYTDVNGCSNSRTMIGSGYTCAARGVSASGDGLVVSSDFTMYPNPAKTIISLSVNTLIGSGSIIITDLYGKQIKAQSLSMGTNIIDVSKLSKGMYLVSTITSEGKTTKKLVVE